VVEDPERAASLGRNAGAIRTMFGESQRPARAGELAVDLRGAMAPWEMPAVDVDVCAYAMVAVGLELGERLLEREAHEPRAPRRATAPLIGGMARADGTAR
jgi:hypothetical protein